MKKISMIIAASAMMLAVGCTKDLTNEIGSDAPGVNGGETITLGVGTSRATLDGTNISLEVGDVISINGTHCEVYAKGEGLFVDAPFASDNIYRAGFPAKAFDSYWKGDEAAYIHSNMQLYQANSFGKAAMPLCAYLDLSAEGATPSLTLKAMMGVLKLTVNGSASVRAINVMDNSLTSLIGTAMYPYAMGGYCFFYADDASSSQTMTAAATSLNLHNNTTGLQKDITLLCNDAEGNGVQLSESGTDFYLVVPAREYANGFTVSISDNANLNAVYKTSGSTTVAVNQITEMQPITYAPAEDLVFAENFDVCVYGTDIVTRRQMADDKGIWRGRTAYARGAACTSGIPAPEGASGFDIGYYYTDVSSQKLYNSSTKVLAGVAGAVYAEWIDVPTKPGYSMDNVVKAGELLVDESFIRLRGFWDWILGRTTEFYGYIGVGYERSATRRVEAWGIPYTNPRSDTLTPAFKNLTETSDVVVTLNLCPADNSGPNDIRFEILSSGEAKFQIAEFINEDGSSRTITDADGNAVPWVVTDGQVKFAEENLVLNEGWYKVRLTIKDADATTSLHFTTSTENKKGSVYYIDNIEVRKTTLADTDVASATVAGKVACNGKAVSGVVVTDGVNITKTDILGRYALPTDIATASHISISIPSGYEMASKINHSQAFFSKVDASASTQQIHNFELTEVNQTGYTLMVMADSHVLGATASAARNGSTEDRATYTGTVMPKWDSYAASCSGRVYGVHLGDMTQAGSWSRYSLANYVADTPSPNCTIFNVIGNHDHDNCNNTNGGVDYTDDTQHLARKSFCEHVGPAYYSFNIGTEHYIALDDVFTFRTEGNYTYALDSKQLAWLRKDVAAIDKSKIKGIVLLVHVPIFGHSGVYTIFSNSATPEQNIISTQEFIDIFQEYPLTIMAGHSHIDRTFQWTNKMSSGKKLIEYLHPSLAGAAWFTDSCCEGTPGSFVAYNFSNGNPTKREYVAYGKNEGLTCRIYDATHNGGPFTASSATTQIPSDEVADARPAVMVTVWNGYSCTFTESTGGKGTTYGSKHSGEPYVYDLNYRNWYFESLNLDDKAYRNSIYKGSSTNGLGDAEWQWPSRMGRHNWRYIPADPDATITFTAKNNLGQVVASGTLKAR